MNGKSKQDCSIALDTLSQEATALPYLLFTYAPALYHKHNPADARNVAHVHAHMWLSKPSTYT